MLDQAFDAAERSRALPESHRAGDGDGSFFAVLYPDGKHAAESPGHLPQSDIVTDMPGEAGIEHRRQNRMPFKTAGELSCGFGLRAHADVEGAHATHQQPRIEGAQRTAVLLAHPANTNPQFALPRGGKGSRDNVRVSVEVFGGGVHNEVGTERKRPSKDRSSDGRIDAQYGAGAMSDLGNRGYIGDRPERIARRLDPEEAGFAGPNRIAYRIDVGRVDEAYAVAIPANLA